MSDALPPADPSGVGNHTPQISVRYWAAARAAAGVESEIVEASTLADVLTVVGERHPTPRFADVIAMCAVLVGAQPVGSRDPSTVRLVEGDTVEFLPPFAGG